MKIPDKNDIEGSFLNQLADNIDEDDILA